MSDTDGLGSSASFLEPPPASEDHNDVDSLPSEPDTDDVTDEDEDYLESDAEREWKESLQQLELLLLMVIVPYVGKYFGRKFAYWGKDWSLAGVKVGLMIKQDGNSSWNGNTPSRSSSRTRLSSRALGRSKLRPHYNKTVGSRCIWHCQQNRA
jgi:hypothetical protein